MEYVSQLFRVYQQDKTPEESEISEYVEEIKNGRSLQDVEDEFKLMQITPPKKLR